MRTSLRLPRTWLVSLLAGLTTWLTVLAWTPFAERPSGYIGPIFGACLIVAVSGMLLRAARVPALLVALAQVLLLALWLHGRWAGDLALGGLVPTGESLRQVADTLRASVDASQSYAAPVPRSVTAFPAVMVLAGSATAVLVDLLACGLRRVPLAGLPLLAVYTAPVSILDGGVSWVKFAVAALSFLFLLAAEEATRLELWGHQLSGAGRLFDSQGSHVTTQAVWSSARKIGLTATGLAVLVPVVVPTLSTSILDGAGNGPGGDGDAVSIANPILDLKRDLVRGADIELVRVTTNDPDPSYLRISVLDAFDGDSWRPSGRSIPVEQRAEGLVPRPPGLDTGVATSRVSYSVRASDAFKSRWLPTPYPVFSIRAPGDWRYDRSTLDFISAADGQTTAGIDYDLEALVLAPTAAQLADSGPASSTVMSAYTALPRDLPDRVRELARTVTDGLPTKFEKAVRLQDWFRRDGGFSYSLERAPGTGLDTLVRFLGDGPGSRVGYCEQFAASMAMMGRAIGIPSRVAVGFLRPDQVGEDTYVYSSHDLHAWPEMYFQGVGWVRFEPTPQARTGTELPSYTVQQLPSAGPSASASAPSSLPSQLNRLDRATESPNAAASGSGAGGLGTGPLLVGFFGMLVLLGLLAVPRLVRDWTRRRRWSAAGSPAALAEAAWAELRDTALDLGVAWDDRVTLRTRARDLVRAFGRPGAEDDALGRGPVRGPAADPESAQALDRLVRLLERARYARDVPPSAATVAQVRADLDRCVAALRAGASRRRRTTATWLPASLGARMGGDGRRRARARARAVGVQGGVDHAV
jgi:transglutaminase-like putative cysteine protease